MVISYKRSVMNEISSMLWHKRLGHISIERLKKLVKEGVLVALDFIDFGTCVDCIKGKQTTKANEGASMSSNILEIVHTDIYGPFQEVFLKDQKYFINFIDDHMQYMYFFLLYDNIEAIDAFKIYKAEVKKQLGKQINIVMLDRGGK